ncbi:hypothetical protein JCM11491_004681 [Sporobolomyces phaffii]
MERTFAVAIDLQKLGRLDEVREALVGHGFRVLAEASIGQEELSQAGLPLNLDRQPQRDDADWSPTVWVLESVDAVKRLNDLNATVRNEAGDDIRLITAPSASAASLSIRLLFPSLDDHEPDSPRGRSIATAATVRDAVTATPTNPFPLSNLALDAPVATSPASGSTRRGLSPKIARALAQLDAPARSGGATDAPPIRESFEPDIQEEEEVDEDERQIVDEPASAHPADGTRASDVRGSEGSLRSRPPTALSVSQGSTTGLSSSTAFKARPAPRPPTAQPRMTKSAALRLGLPLPPHSPLRARSSSSSSLLEPAARSTLRASVPTPKSLAAPAITPRLSRTAALRTGQILSHGGDGGGGGGAPPARHAKRESISTAERAALDRLARCQSVPLPVLAPAAAKAKPVFEVRMSNTARLRMGLSLGTSPSSTSTRLDGPEPQNPAEGASRRTSVSSSLKSLREPTIAPRPTRSSLLRTTAGPGSATASPAVSRSSNRPIAILADADAETSRDPVDDKSTPRPAAARRHSTQVASTKPPAAVHVRMSRASMLRTGQTVAVVASSPTRTASDVNFDGVPGHKRRASVAVPSVHATALYAPRPNRASLLRLEREPGAARPATARHMTEPASGGGGGPRSNRAAELRQQAASASAAAAQARTSHSTATTTTTPKVPSHRGDPRPVSAMSDVSNGSRI